MVHYLKHSLRRRLIISHRCRCDASADYVLLDAATQTNLELVESRSVRDTSLLAVLDRTATPMGGRKLRAWILQPLRDLSELQRRQQMIADLLHEPDLLAAIRGELKSIRDIERATGRLSQASGNARDLVALKTFTSAGSEAEAGTSKLIERIEFGTGRDVSLPQPRDPTKIKEDSADGSESHPYLNLAQRLQNNIHEMPALADKLEKALVDDPPLSLKEGGIFAIAMTPISTCCDKRPAMGKIGSAICRSARLRPLGSNRSRWRYNSVFRLISSR